MPLPSASEIKAKVKAKVEPQLHWKVPFEAGVYENSPKWSNKGNAPPICRDMATESLSDSVQIWTRSRFL